MLCIGFARIMLGASFHLGVQFLKEVYDEA